MKLTRARAGFYFATCNGKVYQIFRWHGEELPRVKLWCVSEEGVALDDFATLKESREYLKILTTFPE